MKFKKIILAAVGAAMICSSLPVNGAVVNFAEDTLKAKAADYATATTTEPYYSTTEPYSYYYGSEEASEAASWTATEESKSWYEDATKAAAAEETTRAWSEAETDAWEETTYPYWLEETTEAWEETTRETETATATDSNFLGDINGDGSIDSKDAVLVLNAYANELVNKESTVDASIGDVNSDGVVNSKDAVFILQYYANRLTGYAGSLTDFISSRTPDTALFDSAAEITIGTVTVKDGYKVDVPVTISNNSGFAGGGLVFNFNKKELGFNGVSGDIIEYPVKSVNNNSVSVTFAYSKNITDNETMFTLHFALPVNAKAGDVFNISGSIDTFCDEYGRNLPVKITDGAVKIDEDYMTDKNVTYNHVNDNETVIEVGNVKVSKEDIGEKVKVPVAIFNNPGFAGTGFGYTYDERMTFSSIDGILIGSPVTASGTNYEAVTSAKSSDLTADSVLYYLNFELPENAKAGDVFSILPSRDVFANADVKDVKVELYGGSITIVGDSEPLKATVKTNELEVGKKTTIEANQDNLTYATSDSNVAVVSKSGEITAISAGTAIITVINSDGETDKIVMTVKDLNLETTIPTENKFLGDLNSDGKTDSKDAVIVLKSYAEKLAGNPTKDDTSAGDVNGDGEVDSKDAVIILRYYASVIAGVFKGNISEFI